MSERAVRVLFALIAIFSLAGMILSAISLQRHYAKSTTDFCDFSQSFNCDFVNRSEYSEFAGIPVAGIGIAGYMVLFFLSTLWRSRPETPTRMCLIAAAGLIYALYLTSIEAFRLHTWCILCVGSQLLIFLITVFAGIVRLRATKA